MARLPRIRQLVTYYAVAAVNTAFGYSLYALLVFLGLNIFVAQVVTHATGMTFNYFTYRRHVFRGSQAAVHRYVLAYGANYLLGLGLLALFHHAGASDYVAGLLATLIGSAVNFFALRVLVFRERPGTGGSSPAADSP